MFHCTYVGRSLTCPSGKPLRLSSKAKTGAEGIASAPGWVAHGGTSGKNQARRRSLEVGIGDNLVIDQDHCIRLRFELDGCGRGRPKASGGAVCAAPAARPAPRSPERRRARPPARAPGGGGTGRARGGRPGAPTRWVDAGRVAFLAPVLQRVLETARTDVEVPWSNPATGNGSGPKTECTFA